MKQNKIKVILFFISVMILMLGCDDSKVNNPENEIKEVTIGALVSLTGNWSTLGITSKAALELAVEEINKKFEDEGQNLKFKLKVMDTKLDPELAYAYANQLIGEGVEVIIGPQSSAELSRIKPLADQKNVLVISMGSTAGSLALEGDHILRFCPDDKPEGLAIARLMWDQGVREVIAVFRDDDGNIGLRNSMTDNFTSLGGQVISSIKYSNDDNITAELIDQISAALNSAGNPGATAVYLAGFDEVADVFSLSESNTSLSGIKWYGSNGSAMSAKVLSTAASARFANQVNYCCPIFALSAEAESKWSPLVVSIEQSTQQKPDAYTFAAYDAVQVAAIAYKSAGASYQFADLLSGYITAAGEYNGLTGLTELNAAGDRKFGNFSLHGICGIDPDFSWNQVGSFNTATEDLVYTGCN